MSFRWNVFSWWLLSSFVLTVGGLGLLGIPGGLFYEGWRIALNAIFQRKVIADLDWAIALYMSGMVPVGLPLSYVAMTKFLLAQTRKISLRKSLIWMSLLTILWSLFPTLAFSMLIASAHGKSL
jgi:hypothetical protein